MLIAHKVGLGKTIEAGLIMGGAVRQEKDRRLLQRNKIEEIGAGLTRFTTKQTSLLGSRSWQRMTGKNGVAAALVLEAVLDFVEGCGAERFAGLVDAVARRGWIGSLDVAQCDDSDVLAASDKFMVMKPAITRRTASRMGFELVYSSPPSWHCERVLGMSAGLLEELAPLGARDYIDVQSFMWGTRHLE